MNRWLIILLVFSLAINLAALGTLVFFWQRPGPPPFASEGMLRPPDGDPMGGPLRGMDIPPEERPHFRQLRNSFQEKVQPYATELHETRQTLMRLLGQKTVAQDSIDLTLQQINKLQSSLEKITVEHFMAIRSHMNDEQWNSFIKTLEKRMPDFRRMPLGNPPNWRRDKNNAPERRFK